MLAAPEKRLPHSFAFFAKGWDATLPGAPVLIRGIKLPVCDYNGMTVIERTSFDEKDGGDRKVRQPLAKLVPADKNKHTDDLFGFMAGKGSITDDVVAPAFSPEEWGDLYFSSRPRRPRR